MHRWGDENVDWAGICDAARFIGERLRKWGRVHVSQYKEKWGTVRVYCYLGWLQVHSLTHPGHAFSRYPKWLWRLDCRLGPPLMHLLNLVAVPYHKWLYRRTYAQAVRRWPHLRKEILCAADWPELLKGL